MRRRLHDDLEQTKEMKQAVIEKLMDELDALQRQLAEVQANTPCATPKEKKSMHAAAAGILQSDDEEDEEDERRKMTTTDLDAARASVEAMNKQAEELKGMHDESERAREETKSALAAVSAILEETRGRKGDSRGIARGRERGEDRARGGARGGARTAGVLEGSRRGFLG